MAIRVRIIIGVVIEWIVIAYMNRYVAGIWRIGVIVIRIVKRIKPPGRRIVAVVRGMMINMDLGGVICVCDFLFGVLFIFPLFNVLFSWLLCLFLFIVFCLRRLTFGSGQLSITASQQEGATCQPDNPKYARSQ
jgi:hypothetical protein